MRNILKVIIISTIITVSLQGWDKFFNWQGSQQRVSCDSDRVSMNYFNDLIIDGEEYYLQDHYETNNEFIKNTKKMMKMVADISLNLQLLLQMLPMMMFSKHHTQFGTNQMDIGVKKLLN